MVKIMADFRNTGNRRTFEHIALWDITWRVTHSGKSRKIACYSHSRQHIMQ